MTPARFLPWRAAALVAFAPLAWLPAYAQQAPLAMTDADALADQVRRVGANPLDLDALLTAGELSLRVGDLSAAGAFFARAEKIDPRSGRAKAGEAGILVRSERPGEALRRFAEAEALGVDPRRFGADRGLAYDLLGDQPRAQRDYRAALALRPDDETRRRLALSLGIAGRGDEAERELAPLIRQNDRAAWRTRAFVLAMAGNAAEASRIAETMMPPGTASGLGAFFVRLPTLPAADRAFAVHFGEVHATPERLADARRAPVLAPLPAEPVAVQVAAVTPAAPVLDRKERRRRAKVGRETIAPAVPTLVASADAPGEPPAFRASPVALAAASVPASGGALASTHTLTAAEQASLAAATGTTSRRDRRRVREVAAASTLQASAALAPADTGMVSASGRVPIALAAASPTIVPAPGFSAAPRLTPTPSATTALAARGASTPIVAAVPTPPPPPPIAFRTAVAGADTPGGVLGAPAGAVSSAPIPGGAAVVAASPPVATPGTSTPLSAPVSVAAAVPAPGFTTPGPSIAAAEAPPLPTGAIASTPLAPLVVPPAGTAVAAVRRPPAPPPSARRPARVEADTILARIVAGLSIPAAELGVGEGTGSRVGARRGAETARAAPVRPAATRAAPPAVDAVDEPPVADARRKPGAAATVAKGKTVADVRAKPLVEAKVKPLDRQAIARQAAADKAAKEEADARKLAKTNPARIWVQVAGGANEGDLAKAWAAARKKAPKSLEGRQGYATPLRATNRVLTGPFKTDAEARAAVNQLAREGLSAFPFTSDAGQAVTRLDSR